MTAASSTGAFAIFDTRLGNVTLPLFTANGSPTNGAAGTLAGVAPPGALLLTTEVALYQNTNTLASPTWSPVASNEGNVAITGGTIDGAAFGQTTQAAVGATKLVLDSGTKTATASAGAATLNKMSGVITSESLTTAAGADYTLTLTDSDIAAGDTVVASVGNGSNTGGVPNLASITPGAGSAVIVIQNIHATVALNGTLKIAFAIIKAA